MPVFTIETPTGRKLDIEAANEAGAIKGAQEWETQNPAKEPAPAKPFGEKLKNFLGNVTPGGPISGLIALGRLSGDAAAGRAPELMTDEGIAKAIPAVVEGSIAAAPSARARPMTVAPKAPVVEAPPAAPAPAAAEGGGFMGGVMKYGVPIAAEVLGTMHGMPGAATLARMTAGHLLSKLAPKDTAPLTSRFEGAPSVGDAVKTPEAPAAPQGPLPNTTALERPLPDGAPAVSPAPAEGNPALVKAREHANVMNALAELAKQSQAKQAQGARDTSALQAAGGSQMNPGIARLTNPAAEMTAGALQGAAGTPMNPGVARLTPEPVAAPPAPVPAPPAPTALPRDVALQGKLLSSGMQKVAKMREAAAKAEATPIEKIIEKAKAPKEAPKPEGVTLDETFGEAPSFKPVESDYAHMSVQDAARHIVEAQKAKGIKFWHAEDSYIKATAGRLGAKGVIASKVAKVVGVPEQTLKSWVQGAKTRTDATALRDHLKGLANKSNHGVIDAAFKEGLKQGWSK